MPYSKRANREVWIEGHFPYQAPRIGAYFRNPPVLRGQAWYCSCLSWLWTGVRHFMWPRSRYRSPLQYKWGTGLCLRKKCLDINQRLIIIFLPCSKKNYVFSFQNASSSVLLAVYVGWAAERSRTETNGSLLWTYFEVHGSINF